MQQKEIVQKKWHVALMQPHAIPCPNRTGKMALSETSLRGGSRDLRPADLEQKTDCLYCFMQLGISLNSWVPQARSKNGWYHIKNAPLGAACLHLCPTFPHLVKQHCNHQVKLSQDWPWIAGNFPSGWLWADVIPSKWENRSMEDIYTNSYCLAFLTASFSWSGGENLIPLPGVLL